MKKKAPPAKREDENAMLRAMIESLSAQVHTLQIAQANNTREIYRRIDGIATNVKAAVGEAAAEGVEELKAIHQQVDATRADVGLIINAYFNSTLPALNPPKDTSYGQLPIYALKRIYYNPDMPENHCMYSPRDTRRVLLWNGINVVEFGPEAAQPAERAANILKGQTMGVVNDFIDGGGLEPLTHGEALQEQFRNGCEHLQFSEEKVLEVSYENRDMVRQSWERAGILPADI